VPAPTSQPPDLYGIAGPEGGLDLGTCLEALRRRRTLAITVFLLALPIVAYLVLTLPDEYVAAAQISVQEQPEVLDFGSDFMPRQQSAGRRRAPLEPLMSVVASDAVMGAVVDQMPAADRREPTPYERVMGAIGLGGAPAELAPEMRRRLRIDSLRRKMELEDAAGGTVIVVRFTARDPARAAFLANAVADSYVSFERERRQAASRLAINWLSQKSNELRDRIRRREEAASKLIQEAGIRVQPGNEGKALLEDNQMALELQRARADLLFVEQQLAQLQPDVEQARGTGGPAGPSARERYLEAGAQLEALRLQFTPSHPEVQRLETVVESLRSAAERETFRPATEQILGEHSRLLSERARLRARVSVLTQALDGQKSGDPNSEALSEYQRLERELLIDRQLLQVLLQRTNETALEAAGATDRASVLDYAMAPVAPAAPDRPLLALGGVAGALALAVGLALLREMVDPRVYKPEDATRALGTSYLGSIPLVGATEAERRGLALYASPAGEGFRNVRTSLLFASGGSRLRSLLVTSAVAGEGKTTVSTNLAGAFASVGRRVLLIDADMRRPRVDRVLELKRSPGLSELLDGAVSFEQVVHRTEENLDVLTSGAVPQNPTELLSSTAFDLLFSRAKKAYDLVLIDAPILLAVSDALLLSGRVDGVLIVHKPGSVDRKALTKMSEDLRRMDANLLGVIFNQVSLSDPYQYPSYMRSPYVAGSTAPRRWLGWPRKAAQAREGKGKTSS
jgi:capsular exopolysaccharide synthesis family protein